MKHIKDPIYGYIDVPDEELSIINTSIFQRLRRIKQLGLSSTVYPSASHSRFSHSLGVMHLTRRLGESIDLDESEVRINQVAGLFHDAGHLPFSHTLEPIFEQITGLDHEKISCMYIDEILDDPNVTIPCDPEKVKSIIMNEEDYDGVNLVSNDEIDCDRLDYLIRDSYNTGIELGKIEQDTLIKFAKNINGSLGFNHKSLRSVERLLDARMQMNYSVYSHDTVNITETMLRRSFLYHVNNTDFDVNSIIGLDDGEMSSILTNSDSKNARMIFNRVRNRNLYKTAYYKSLTDLNQESLQKAGEILENAEKHESKIADMAGLDDHLVMMSAPTYSHISEYETPIIMPNGDIMKLEQVSPKPDSLRESQIMTQNIHVFTTKENVDTVQKNTEKYFKSIDNLESIIE